MTITLASPRLHALWPRLFEAERSRLREVLDPSTIEHVGSTAIPTIAAKPYVDIAVQMPRDELSDDEIDGLQALGYEGRCRPWAWRSFTRVDKTVPGAWWLHVFALSDGEFERKVRFRDHLRAHHDDARAYEQLKRTLAAAHPNDPVAYTAGKSAFVEGILTRAAPTDVSSNLLAGVN